MKFTSKVEGKMRYEDFVYFMLSEEDKSSEPSLEYWYLLLLYTYPRFPFAKYLARKNLKLLDSDNVVRFQYTEISNVIVGFVDIVFPLVRNSSI